LIKPPAKILVNGGGNETKKVLATPRSGLASTFSWS
jgi:hypothetical protein